MRDHNYPRSHQKWNRVGRHYSRFLPFLALSALAYQALGTRKFLKLNPNPRSRAKLTSGQPGFRPRMTHGPASGSSSVRIRIAGALRGTTLGPDFESARRRERRSKSTCSQRSVKISLTRQPVNTRRRIAAIAAADTRPERPRSCRAFPRRASSSSLKNRSRFRSAKRSTWRTGLVPSLRRPQRSARLNIFERRAKTRFAWYGVALS